MEALAVPTLMVLLVEALFNLNGSSFLVNNGLFLGYIINVLFAAGTY